MAQNDVDVAIAAAETGAVVVRAMYGAPLERFDKGAGDFATAADVEAERAIVEVLRAARPRDVIVGEESGESGETGVAASTGLDRRWLVDPLCGTLNYAARTMLVSVNVALRVGSVVTVAAVADPFAEELFWCSPAGAGVRHGGVDAPLRPSAASALVDVNLDPPFPNRPTFSAVRLLADDDFGRHFRPRVISSTLAATWVAAGRRAAYVTDGVVRDSVHFASGVALCRAAGCVVSGLDGRPLDDGVGGLVVAADAVTHDRLLTMIARQRGDGPV